MAERRESIRPGEEHLSRIQRWFLNCFESAGREDIALEAERTREAQAATVVATTSGGGLKGLEGATIGGALALAVAGGAVYLNKKGEKWKGMGKSYLKGVPGQFKGLTRGGYIEAKA